MAWFEHSKQAFAPPNRGPKQTPSRQSSQKGAKRSKEETCAAFLQARPGKLCVRDPFRSAERPEYKHPSLEKAFWGFLEEIAADEGYSVPRFISTLHREILLLRGEVPNFTSHLRCICLVARTGRERAEAA